MKKRTLLSSIVTIVLCLSLIAGSTFALFTSEDTVNIAINAAKVKMTATIADDTLELYSIGDYMGDGVTVFENGGTAAINAEKDLLTLERITPGDEVKFDVQMYNESNVHILYRVQYNVVDAIDSKLYAFGETIWKEWKMPANDDERYRTSPVSVYFDVIAGNDYQEKDLAVSFTVEAIQANADVYDALLATSETAEIQDAMIAPAGGVVDGNGKTIDISVDDQGLALVHNNPVTLQNVTIDADSGAIAGVYANGAGSLELGKDAVINAADGAQGVFYLFTYGNKLVLGEGSVINADGASSACLRLDCPSGSVDIVFGGSDVLNPTNGAKGIYVTCGFGTYNLYVESEADMHKYQEMIVEEPSYVGTNTFNWFINGVLVTP